MSSEEQSLFYFTMSNPRLHALFVHKSKENIESLLGENLQVTNQHNSLLATSVALASCVKCNGPFKKLSVNQRFCSKSCRIKNHNLRRNLRRSIGKKSVNNKNGNTGFSAAVLKLLQENEDGVNTEEISQHVKHLSSNPNSVYSTLHSLKNQGLVKVIGKFGFKNIWAVTK